VRVHSQMNREIRNPGLGNRINRILRDLPPISIDMAEEIFRPLCVRTTLVGRSSKNSKPFSIKMDQTEHWVDGFVTAGGRNLSIVSGMFVAEVDPTGTTRKCQMIFCVRNVELFIAELRKVVLVMTVQQS
jgi:hypothetical protein